MQADERKRRFFGQEQIARTVSSRGGAARQRKYFKMFQLRSRLSNVLHNERLR